MPTIHKNISSNSDGLGGMSKITKISTKAIDDDEIINTPKSPHFVLESEDTKKSTKPKFKIKDTIKHNYQKAKNIIEDISDVADTIGKVSNVIDRGHTIFNRIGHYIDDYQRYHNQLDALNNPYDGI